MTLKKFCADCQHIDASLIRAVVRQIGGWPAFQEMAGDVARHGADCGWHGFIYCADTVAFCKRNKQAIMQLARQQADDFGVESVYVLIGSFNCLKLSADTVAAALLSSTEHSDEVYNTLSWYTLEEVSAAFVNWKGCR